MSRRKSSGASPSLPVRWWRARLAPPSLEVGRRARPPATPSSRRRADQPRKPPPCSTPTPHAVSARFSLAVTDTPFDQFPDSCRRQRCSVFTGANDGSELRPVTERMPADRGVAERQRRGPGSTTDGTTKGVLGLDRQRRGRPPRVYGQRQTVGVSGSDRPGPGCLRFSEDGPAPKIERAASSAGAAARSSRGTSAAPATQ